MPLTIEGVGKFDVNAVGARSFTIPTGPSLTILKEIVIKYHDILMNDLGLYKMFPVGRNQKAKMSTITTPRNLLQSRKSCGEWVAKGKMGMNVDEIDTFPIEVMMEQCPDQLFGDCLEYVLGTGNDIRDITATEEGRTMLAAMLDLTYVGLNNSLFDLATFGGYGKITESDTNAWYDTVGQTSTEWAEFKDQMINTGVTGHITKIDNLAAADANKYAHLALTIDNGNVSGGDYTGSNVTIEFDKAVKGAKSKFRAALNARGTAGGANAAMLVSTGIFDAYQEYLDDTFAANIPEQYGYFINGQPVNGILRYQGLPVVRMDEWGIFDETVGINQHRILLVLNGNLGLALDTEELPTQASGTGLILEQRLDLPYKGQVYMNGNFRLGADIVSTDYVVCVKNIQEPA